MADPTIIDAGTRVDGRITGDADVTVRGRVHGEIDLSQTLSLEPIGSVYGTIRAHDVQIDGAVEGDIFAQARIILGATARVVGSLEAPAIVMADGAQFAGEVRMELDAEAPRPVAARASSPRARSTTTQAARPSPARAPASAAPAATRSPAPAARPAAATASSAASSSSAAAPQSATTVTVVEEVVQAAPEEAAAPAEASSPPESVTDLQELTVKELREELRDLDLQVSGTKDELIERLEQAKQA